MKRAWYIAAVVALVLPAMGQIRGVPASVTSMAPWRSFTPGPPASVTSLGPYGYSTPCFGTTMGCTPTQFTSGSYYPDARDRGPVNLRPKRHHNNNAGAYYPVYVPYAYPVAVAAEPEPEAEAEPDPPAPTIFEHRATTAHVPSASADSSRYARQPTVADDPSPADARQQIPVVLVYRDGHEQEVTNYAIVGPTLYDLGTFVAHKIPLVELNLKATIKANDDRGVEFSVPASVKMD